MVIGACLTDIAHDAIPDNEFYKLGAAILIEQGINALEVIGSQEQKPFMQRVRYACLDDPVRVAGMYLGHHIMAYLKI